MLGACKQHSEVARILAQVSAEYEAAQQCLTGLSYGVSQHTFITKRMETIGQLHSDLRALVGDAAMPMIAEQLNATPDPVRQSGQPGQT